MDDNQNDYDRIAQAIDEALAAFTGNAHEPPRNNNSDSITITIDGFITGVIRLQRLRDLVNGLAKAHRQPNEDRYPMCQDQPAQIDCRVTGCFFHKDGKCQNTSPAITLNQNGLFACWSRDSETKRVEINDTQ